MTSCSYYRTVYPKCYFSLSWHLCNNSLSPSQLFILQTSRLFTIMTSILTTAISVAGMMRLEDGYQQEYSRIRKEAENHVKRALVSLSNTGSNHGIMHSQSSEILQIWLTSKLYSILDDNIIIKFWTKQIPFVHFKLQGGLLNCFKIKYRWLADDTLLRTLFKT